MKEEKFTDEEIESISQLGEILYSIVQRLVDEGKAKVVDGKIIFLDDEKE